MEADAIAQLVSLLMVGLGIVWHQQRSTDKVRDDVNTGLRELRQDHDRLRDDVAGIGQRLARSDSRASKASWGSIFPPLPTNPKEPNPTSCLGLLAGFGVPVTWVGVLLARLLRGDRLGRRSALVYRWGYPIGRCRRRAVSCLRSLLRSLNARVVTFVWRRAR